MICCQYVHFMSILRFHLQYYTLENISKDDTEVVIKSCFITRLEHILVLNVGFILNYENLEFHYYHLSYGQE